MTRLFHPLSTTTTYLEKQQPLALFYPNHFLTSLVRITWTSSNVRCRECLTGLQEQLINKLENHETHPARGALHFTLDPSPRGSRTRAGYRNVHRTFHPAERR